MIDVSLVIGIGMAVTSVGVLYKAKTAPPAITKAVCPCGHAINFHEKLSGACKFVAREPVAWSDTRPIKWAEFRCYCQVYAGPELIRGITGLPVLPLPEVVNDDN